MAVNSRHLYSAGEDLTIKSWNLASLTLHGHVEVLVLLDFALDFIMMVVYVNIGSYLVLICTQFSLGQ